MIRATTGTVAATPIARAPVPAPLPVAPPVTVTPAPPVALAPVVRPSANPYPNGVTVAGTGPNGSSTVWRTGYHTAMGVWVADSGFGIAPIYTDAEYASILAPRDGVPFLKGAPNENFEMHSQQSIDNGTSPPQGPYTVATGVGTDINGNPYAGPVPLFSDPGSLLTIMTTSGGTQTVWYTKDANGYNVPAHAQGNAKPSASIFDTLVMAGAIVGAVVISAGGAAGVLGPATAGPGAGALAGSPSDLAAGSYATAAAPTFSLPAPTLTPPSPPSPPISTPPSLPPEIASPPLAPITAPPVPAELAPLNIAAPTAGAGATDAGITGGEILSGLRTAGTVASIGGTAAGLVGKLTSGSASGQALPPARPITAPTLVPTRPGVFTLSPGQGSNLGGFGGSQGLILPLMILAVLLVVMHGSS